MSQEDKDKKAKESNEVKESKETKVSNDCNASNASKESNDSISKESKSKQAMPSDPQDRIFSDPAAVSKKEKTLVVTILFILLVVAGLAIYGFLTIKQGPDTIQGQAEASEIRIAGKLPGRVEDIYVEEGQLVREGDTLIHIKSSLVEARMDQAKAMETAAQATDKKVDAGTRVQIVQTARDVWEQAKAATGIAQKTYERLENLFQEGVVSEQKRDEAKAAFDAATAGEAAAKSQYELALAGPQEEDKQASKAMVKVAKGGVQEVKAILEDQYLVAPCDGRITVVYPNVSELIATGAPLMQLQKHERWAVFNMRETSLKDIKEGTIIRVRIPALDMETDMEVFYIKDMGTYANWQATKSTGDFDARTFQVKARPDKDIENFRPGMSVIFLGVKKQK